MNNTALDLNLLPVLDAVLRERSATRAAAKLGLTQPAVSNALARLRRTFADPLVVKSHRGLTPTPRALEIQVELSEALRRLERAVRPSEPLSLLTTERQWALSFADHYGSLLLPPLMRWMATNAPRASLKLLPLERMLFEDALASGGVDLYVGIPGVPMPGCRTRHFFDDELVCVGSSSAAPVRSLEQFLARGHVKIQLSPGRGNEVDDALAALRRTRRVVLTLAHFSSALAVVEHSELLTVVPRNLAEVHGERLRVMRVPLSLPRLSVSMFWHRRVHEDLGVKALRQALLGFVGSDRRLQVKRG
ncbi:MAG TPA: LysR family transcriptional regulator [Polyangiaceae bacterium]|nr:LysR family transcriptional regulator [Polyangiaceae bacterium]